MKRFSLATAVVAAIATGLSACAARGRMAGEEFHFAARAGCQVPPSPPLPPPDPRSTHVCSVAPDTPPCRMDEAELDRAASLFFLPSVPTPPAPMHLRPSCAAMYRPVEGHELRRDLWAELERSMGYPDGPDVVIAGLAVDGVDFDSAQVAAHVMLWPLSRCYLRHVDDVAKTAPQGRLFVVARVEADGTVDGVRIDTSPGLPQDLVACAQRYVRTARLGRPYEDPASVEIDVRFVYRRLM